MNEYKIIFGFLLAYGLYNIVNLQKSNLLTKLNASFYSFVIITAIYGMFFLQKSPSPSSHPHKKNHHQSSQNKLNHIQYENRVKITQINQNDHSTILKKLDFDLNLPQNKQFELKNIYKINNKIIEDRFYEYQKSKMDKVKLIGKCGPCNTNYGFHGTRKTCSGFDKVCQDRQDCSFCNILIHGFRNSYSGKGQTTHLRFGKGTYFSPEILKALQYCQSDDKILLCCKIVMGRVFRPIDEENYYTYFQENQFDCVYADPQFTLGIKSPEICIKNEKGSLPKYILIFRQKNRMLS